MRPGRVNTYHNDPFVAAAANNAFVIAPFSLFLPPAVPRCSSYRVISESLFHPCVYLPGLCPASIFWTDLWRFASETRFRLGDLDNFPSRHGTRRKKIELNADSCSRLSWDLREEISKFARVLRSYDVLNMEKLAYWKGVCGNLEGINNRKCRGTYLLFSSFHRAISMNCKWNGWFNSFGRRPWNNEILKFIL